MSPPKMEHLFSPNSSGHLRSDAHQSQIIGEDADVNHTQTTGGGIQSNYWMNISRGGQSSRKIYLSRRIVTYSKMPFK